MSVSLKKLSEQVVVVTGASSGIGLATAREAARRGARVVLVARDEIDLRSAADAIRADGGRAMYVAADVADFDQVAAVAERTVDAFGGIDTWVNNAGVSIYGRITDVPLADARRLFETNYWGLVHGSLVAVPHLRRGGGVLINVGSVLSDTTMPLQGHYSASKHAVKGFTDALRIELEEEDAPVAVVLVKPAAIDTPYPEHAANHLGVGPKHQAPVYAPDVVAAAILDAAEHPAARREGRRLGQAVHHARDVRPAPGRPLQAGDLVRRPAHRPAGARRHHALRPAAGRRARPRPLSRARDDVERLHGRGPQPRGHGARRRGRGARRGPRRPRARPHLSGPPPGCASPGGGSVSSCTTCTTARPTGARAFPIHTEHL
jgi:NAD(P)-dependent dehydrogenase (short-subunit alcohol dehydrogenase family)